MRGTGSVGPGFSFGSFYETDRSVISRTLCGTCVPRAEPSLNAASVSQVRFTGARYTTIVFTRSFE